MTTIRTDPLLRRVLPQRCDLVDLILLNKQWEIEDALAARKARRPQGQQTYRARAAREHRARMECATAFKGERA